MRAARVPATTVATLRQSIAGLDWHSERVVVVRVVWKDDDGYYVEDFQIDDIESDPLGKPRRRTVLHCGQIVTARMRTKYYKSAETLRTDLARLFTRESVPPYLDIEEVNWWIPFAGALGSEPPA